MLKWLIAHLGMGAPPSKKEGEPNVKVKVKLVLDRNEAPP